MSAGGTVDRSVVAVQQRQGGELALPPMTTQMIVDRREQIRDAINSAMVEGVHYGLIPGTNQLSLLKDGAEMLLAMFHIAVEPIVTDLCTPTEVRFKVECRGIHIATQAYVGSGIGVCTSNEEKYRWRKVRSRKEYDAAAPEHRRIKYNREFEDLQVRQSPYDVFQTIMSMAKKRGMVDLAKTALAASECLKGKQPAGRGPKPDIKKQVDETRAGNTKKDPPAGANTSAAGPTSRYGGQYTDPAGAAAVPGGPSPGAKTPAQGAAAVPPAGAVPKTLISDEQAETIARMIDRTGVPETEFFATYEVNALRELEASRFDAAVSWLARFEY